MSSSYSWVFISFLQRELRDRFSGTGIGMAWAFLQPLLMLGLYGFVFSFVFRIRLPGSDSALAYVAFVAIALWPWFMFQESLMRSMSALRAQATLVRKTSLARDLPVMVSVSATILIHGAGYLLVLVVLSAFGMEWHISGLPLFALTSAIIAIATYLLGMVASIAQMVWRDLEQALQPILMILFYLTPILYPLSLVPEEVRSVAASNPFAWAAGRLRDAIQLGALPAWTDCAILLVSLGMLFGMRHLYLRVARQAEDLL